jgi:hypothetical protein
MPKKPSSIFDFVYNWKKGGKKLRTIVNRVLERDIKLSETRCFLTFSGLIDLAPDPDYDLSAWLSAWNINSLTNNLRVFIFNYRFNSLPLNNRLNAYMPEINPLCTFCRATNNTPVPRDSLLHCFYNCPYAQLLISHLKGWLGIDRDIDQREFSLLYWYGAPQQQTATALNKLAYILIFDIFRFVFFTNRVRKRLLPVNIFFEEFVYCLQNVCKFNKNFKIALTVTFRGTRLLRAMG